jgi:ribosome biogenesis GTPase A
LEFERRKGEMWNPGHIVKAKRKISELVKAVNYVLEVRDVRAPCATGAYEREKLFKGKKTVIVLNKSDLADDEVTKEWIEFYQSRGEKVITSKKHDRSKFLLKKLFGDNLNVRALVVGMPNVGKSSFINRVVGRKALRVGGVPGITRGVQWLQVNDRIRFLDTPGIIYTELFSKKIIAKLLLTGVLTVEQVDDWEVYSMAFDILRKRYIGLIRDLAGDYETFDEFIETFGRKRGMVQKGGKVDTLTDTHKFFHDVYMGNFGKMSFETPREMMVG